MKDTFEKFKNSIKEIAKYCGDKNLKSLLNLFLEMILIVLIIAIFKFPFILIRDFGIDFVTSMGIPLNGIVLGIWNILWDLSYTLFGIYVFMKIIGKRYENLSKKVK